VSVVSWGSAGTVLGWISWDMWIGQEERARSLKESAANNLQTEEGTGDDNSSVASSLQQSHSGLGLSIHPSVLPSRSHSRNRSSASLHALSPATSPVAAGIAPPFANYTYYPPYNAPPPILSVRNQQRLATVKSALLIYGALLGLSPILKSLTKSTTSDSIWAMSTWLMFINVFFFDYGGEVEAKFPASLSTNAALITPHQHHPRLFAHTVLDRSFRPLSCLPKTSAASLVASSCAFNDATHRRGRDRSWYHSDRGHNVEGRTDRMHRLGTRQHVGNGRLLLVVDRTTTIQERGHRAMGSCKTHHSSSRLGVGNDK
jgi:hypothetical protein